MHERSDHESEPLAEPTARFPLCAGECTLLAEASHRAANQFALLTSYIHLSLGESGRGPDDVESLQLVLVNIEAKARALASLNRLLTPRPAAGQVVDVSIALHEICASFGSRAGPGRRVVDAVMGPCLVTPGAGLAIAQIVTEAIMNALKHAYPEGAPGDVTVRTSTWEPGKVLIEVVDRGVGNTPVPPSPVRSGLGLRLMHALAGQENIGLSFVDAQPGLSVRIVAPAAPGDTEATPG